jgi:HK97 family phage major capsid protein
MGITTGITVGSTATGTDSVTRAELVTLMTSVPQAYRSQGTFLISAEMEASLLAAVDGNGNGIPVFPEMAQGKLVGRPYAVEPNLGAMTTGQTPAVFGWLGAFQIRRVRPLVLVRASQRFAEEGQVGFVAFERVDSMTVAADSPVKSLVLA